MAITLAAVILDAADLEKESRFWHRLLGGEVQRRERHHIVTVAGSPALAVQLAPAALISRERAAIGCRGTSPEPAPGRSHSPGQSSRVARCTRRHHHPATPTVVAVSRYLPGPARQQQSGSPLAGIDSSGRR